MYKLKKKFSRILLRGLGTALGLNSTAPLLHLPLLLPFLDHLSPLFPPHTHPLTLHLIISPFFLIRDTPLPPTSPHVGGEGVGVLVVELRLQLSPHSHLDLYEVHEVVEELG